MGERAATTSATTAGENFRLKTRSFPRSESVRRGQNNPSNAIALAISARNCEFSSSWLKKGGFNSSMDRTVFELWLVYL